MIGDVYLSYVLPVWLIDYLHYSLDLVSPV